VLGRQLVAVHGQSKSGVLLLGLAGVYCLLGNLLVLQLQPRVHFNFLRGHFELGALLLILIEVSVASFGLGILVVVHYLDVASSDLKVGGLDS